MAKAGAVAGAHPEAVVIGSDQIALFNGQVIGKPGSAERACSQLGAFSGQTAQFLTAVAVIRARDDVVGQAVVETRVEFRELGDPEIARYVEVDQPFDCAGSFRAESLGPVLFESVFSQDPTAIIGLPLIETCRLLRASGFDLP
jgi:septum formation protein